MKHRETTKASLIAKFMGPTWGPPGAGRTQVGPMLAPWTLLSGLANTMNLPYDPKSLMQFIGKYKTFDIQLED